MYATTCGVIHYKETSWIMMTYDSLCTSRVAFTRHRWPTGLLESTRLQEIVKLAFIIRHGKIDFHSQAYTHWALTRCWHRTFYYLHSCELHDTEDGHSEVGCTRWSHQTCSSDNTQEWGEAWNCEMCLLRAIIRVCCLRTTSMMILLMGHQACIVTCVFLEQWGL